VPELKEMAHKVHIESEWNSRREDGMFWNVDIIHKGEYVAAVYGRTRRLAIERATLVRRVFEHYSWLRYLELAEFEFQQGEPERAREIIQEALSHAND
jgi:hypothetical protein